VNLLLSVGKHQPLQRTGKDRWCADGILSRNGKHNRVCTRLRLPHPRPQLPDDLGEHLPGIAPDAALHCHVAIESDVAQRTERPGEVRVTHSRLETVAIGEVDVGGVDPLEAHGCPFEVGNAALNCGISNSVCDLFVHLRVEGVGDEV
jgi:hypothetical protein